MSAPWMAGSAFRRARVLLGLWMVAFVVLTARAAEIQLRSGATWRAEADRQHRGMGTLPAPRGQILARDGLPLAQSHEVFRVAVAPHELRDRGVAADRLVEVLGIAPEEARRITQSDRRWIPLPQPYPPRVREELRGIAGIHLEREYRRFHPQGAMALGLLGGVVDQAGSGGVEEAFDAHLQGVPGSRVIARDSGGRPLPGEGWLVRAPQAGGDVVLTLDRELQEIAEEALLDAMRSSGARGGSLLVSDPWTGELLAMASVQDGQVGSLAGFTSPYEPGSTLKPFTLAALVELGRASMQDTVHTGDGRLRIAGRTITDVSKVGSVTLSDALRVSSNIGIVLAAEALEPAEQYEILRDFGFGVATGLGLPGEAAGTLRHPRQWSRQSAASLAMGYEVAVTPLQMLMAYGALANGGLLMEPRIVRETRDRSGGATPADPPRVIRRVISEETARTLNQALVEAVSDGTGGQARLATFTVAGKSGTSRAMGSDARYEQGAYYASFVGFFPAERPQLVIYVKLDRPQGTFFGGATAAPVTRATMEAILAARQPPLDRQALAMIARRGHVDEAQASGAQGVPALLASWQAAALQGGSPTRESSSVLDGMEGLDALHGWGVPDIRGLPARVVLRQLHARGFEVAWHGSGRAQRMDPAPGTLLPRGSVVHVYGDDLPDRGAPVSEPPRSPLSQAATLGGAP
jgi:cell division protein FtsI (penicillin-binding protein 3)